MQDVGKLLTCDESPSDLASMPHSDVLMRWAELLAKKPYILRHGVPFTATTIDEFVMDGKALLVRFSGGH